MKEQQVLIQHFQDQFGRTFYERNWLGKLLISVKHRYVVIAVKESFLADMKVPEQWMLLKMTVSNFLFIVHCRSYCVNDLDLYWGIF